ncbi:DMT family transporter [Corynebacterium uterequi]|uniref:Cation/cationic drug transporter n=1 Tax=Corynebacterium uterequi TaxID=1072256 RepID=A0A0G3H9Q5_9CORY|nr:SMR family transporter [Corynebacterium uterequi]AKK10106.1 cation/cationic drug transporter [Corynebacterium uterequi]
MILRRPATWLAAAIALEVVTTLTLKAALMHPWLYVAVAAGYVATFFCLDRTLRLGMAVGRAYGIWGAIGVALTAVLSAVFFAEPLTGLMGVGIVLIIVGVLLIELGGPKPQEVA